MSRERPLRGGCSCGRNTYIIEVPPNSTEIAQVFFDKGSSHRRSQASPLSAWLRVPLAWYHSTTYAFFDDETHNSIRRVYTSPHEQSAKRHFCGFCGTPLSYWSESPPSEAEYISLTLGSLSGNDLRDLEELGLLPKEALGDAEGGTVEPPSSPTTGALSTTANAHADLPWFDEMIQGSNLGKIKRSRGKEQTEDGRFRVEWEIVEWTDDGTDHSSLGSGKRKLEDVEGVDAIME